MPRNFATTDDGRPTASHIWEEQFLPLRAKGHVGPPPAADLRKRIAQLEAAQKLATESGIIPPKGWQREIDWRKRELEILKLMEEPDGDPEHKKQLLDHN